MRPPVQKRHSATAVVLFDVLDPIPFGFLCWWLIFDAVYINSADVMWFKSAAWLISIWLFFAVMPRLINLALVWFVRSGTNLPALYRGGAFIGEHGSWDRSPLSGYEVSYVKFVDGRPTGQKIPVVTGFASGDEKSLFGAPVGLAQAADGALLIADDVGNVVWSVTASGK